MERSQVIGLQKSWVKINALIFITCFQLLLLAVYPSTLLAYGPPLVEAASQNDIAQVQALLRQGEDPNLAGFDGATALVHATRHQNTDMIRALFDKGADIHMIIDGKRNLLLTHVGAVSDPIIVSLFLDHGLPVDISAENGKTLLMIASHNGATQVVQVLLSRGADINATDNEGMTPLHNAVAGYSRSATISYLLKHGARIDSARRDGSTPLMEASRKGRADFVEMLIQKGANINAQDERGETPLIRAAQMGHASVVQILLSHGANIASKRKQDGATALSLAESTHVKDIIQLLRGADAHP